MALSFLRQQSLAAGATILLPEPLAAANPRLLGRPARRYRSAADILAAVKDCQPDIVCLFSGYLLSNNRLVDRRELAALVETLAASGVTVATSDFSLGLAPRLTPNDYDETLLASSGWLWRTI